MKPTALKFGADGVGEFIDAVSTQSRTAFYRVRRVPRLSPLDLDRDGIDDLYELSRPALLDPLNAADANQDPNNNGRTHLQDYLIATTPLTTFRETSPKQGEGDVAVTRETAFRFTQPLAQNTILATRVYAEFGGRRILSRIALASDRKTATLFYLEDLPASARVRVTFDGNGLQDFLGRALDLDGDGQPGGIAAIDFDTLGITPIPGTAVIGHVFASEKMPGPGNAGLVNRPLAGVTITVDGMEETLRATTDAEGFFRLEPVPAGRFFVLVDGRTVTDVAAGAYYPFVGKAWEAVAGRTNNLAGGTGEVFLPLITSGTLQPASMTEDTPVTFPTAVLANSPFLAGVSITIPANGLFSDDGSRGGKVGIAPVAPDRLPEPLPPGLSFPLVITIQTDGPSNFDRPVPVRFPNLPDPVSGVKLLPGQKSALWSFNHDKGHWEVVGAMTVSADGQFVESDPGVGMLQPGWHAASPGTSASGGPPLSLPSDSPPLEFGPREPLPPLPPDPPDPGDPPPPPPKPDCPKLSAWQKAELAYNLVKDVADCAAALAGAKEGLQCALNAAKVVTELGFSLKRLKDEIDSKQSTAQTLSASFSFLKKEKESAVVLTECFEKISPLGKVEAALTCIGNVLGLANTVCGSIQPSDPNAPERCKPSPSTQKICIGLDAAKALHGQALDIYKRLNAAKEKLALAILCSQLNNLENAIKVALNLPSGAVGKQALLSDGSLTEQDLALIAAAINATLPELESYLSAADPLDDGFAALELAETKFDELLAEGSRALRETGQALETRLFFALEINGNVIRDVTSAQGTIQRPIAPEADYVLRMFDPLSSSYGEIRGRTAPNGQPTQLRDVKLGSTAAPTDRDSDGLIDAAEFVIGTDPTKADTDGDGIGDGAEIRQGTSPLDGVPASTGVIASVGTPGFCLDVCTANDLAVVACGEAGVVLFDIKNTSNPVRIAQVDTPGVAKRVACAGDLIAVADGLEGLAVIEITDPATARIIHRLKLSGSADAVANSGGLAYVGLSSGQVAVVDLGTGAFLGESLALSRAVQDLALNGDHVFVGTAEGLYVLALSLQEVAKVPAQRGFGGIDQRIFVGGGFAYGVESRGFNIFNVGDPIKPVLVSSSPDLLRSQWTQVVPSGSGLGLAIVNRQLSLYDFSDPTRSDVFLTQIEVGGATAVSIYNGLAYVADAALRVVNFRETDRLGKPPTISLATTFSLSPAQVDEGKLHRITARVTDDVQVRNVEFHMDGERVATDGNVPFEYRFVTPSFSETKNSFLLRAKATDTGGNEAWTEEIRVALLQDLTPPTVVNRIPANEAVVAVAGSVAAFFSEPINPETISALTFQLKTAGPDGSLDTADDTAIAPTGFEWRPALLGAFMKFNGVLPPGRYRATVSGGIYDLKGNKLAAADNWSFQVAGEITRELRLPTLAAGAYHTVAIKADGTLWAWGYNSQGQLGDPRTDFGAAFDLRKPAQIGRETDWLTVEAGFSHTVALKKDGSLWTWGFNGDGQLGDGTQNDRSMPAQLGSDKDWKWISAGSGHTLAIKTDGSLWSWGGNRNGQLGDGTREARLTPVRVGTGTDWFVVVAGSNHTLALKTDGTLWAWGSNSSGKLGDGSGEEQLTPVWIGTDKDWSYLAAFAGSSFAVKTDGSLWAWGSNSSGQLGDGTTNRRETPTRIGLGNDWDMLGGGSAFDFPSLADYTFTLGLKLDGSLWGWGANQAGQLGDGTKEQRLEPVRIGPDKDWTVIAAGDEHSIGLKADGSLWGWGDNNRFGQLGIWPDIDNKSVPVRIGASNDWGTAP
ncbi:MAG: Ig-like domain-containing protein [Verrucomicrobiales bacterium]|nr:Ig-like domain-containing protein [Verrucomicrobiales bacterium]